tara:strand:- start:223 stop:834 length:612 start_codon:yes stop_codon:yes gene_type:complete
MKSLSEIETTSKRATRAAGYTWGVAEEVAKCIRLLELFGFQGVKNLNHYYKKRVNKSYEILSSIKKNNKSKSKSFCPLILGVSFLDQVKNLETLNKCTFKKIAYPILFLPFLSRASEVIGKKILFKFDKNEFLLNFNLNISSNFLKKSFPLIAKNTEVSFLDNKDTFTDGEWKNLYKLSEKTFVDETDSLKEGAAGAGLTDND